MNTQLTPNFKHLAVRLSAGLLAAICAALLLAGCSLSGRVPPPDIVDTWQPPAGATAAAAAAPPLSCDEIGSLFTYDASAPLDIREASRGKGDGLTVIDLTYASPKGGRVPAILILPEGKGPFAGILYQHGAPDSRKDLIPSAKTYARLGAVVIAIDAPFNRRPGYNGTNWETFTEEDRLEQIQLIVDLRRAIDLLLSRQDVDPQRLAYVGESYGAAIGGLLAGVEDRLQGYALVVGLPGVVTHVAEKHPAALTQQWVAWMWPIEPIHYVGCASPAALLYQNGAQDVQVPPADALRFQEAGSEPKTILWYKDGHHMASLQAFHDQANWLRGIIGIASYRMAFPVDLRAILLLWFLLTAASLVFLIFDLRRTEPAPDGAWFLWLLTTALLGPLGVVAYWLSFRRTRDAGRSNGTKPPARRALGSAAWAAAGTMTGLIVVLGLIINLQMTLLDNFAVAIALFVLVFLLPIGTSRLSYAASRWLSRSDERFLKATRRPFGAEVVSTLTVLLAACPVLVALVGAYFASWSQPRWMMWGIDLLYPPLWAGFSLATLAGMLIAYPFHLWMVRRGTIRRGEMTAASPMTQRG